MVITSPGVRIPLPPPIIKTVQLSNCKTVKLTNSPSQIKFASRVSLPVCEFDSLRENEAMTNGEFKVELENVPSAFLSQFCEHFVSFPSVLNLAI